MKKGIRAWATLGMLVAAMCSATQTRAPAQSCYVTKNVTVCACTGCLYTVFYGARIGLPPSVEVALCTGTNPGFVTASCGTAAKGLNSSRWHSALLCGTATLVSCCGGARATAADWGGYTFCSPTGASCGNAGTGTL